MKNLIILSALLFNISHAISQNNVFVGSSGVIVGIYNQSSDIILKNDALINDYLLQKKLGGNIISWNIEKENGYAYLVYSLQYVNSNGGTALRNIAETLHVDQPTAKFKNSSDCEDHFCDACTDFLVCTGCAFVKENGKIVGCKCTAGMGQCCHTVTSGPCKD